MRKLFIPLLMILFSSAVVGQELGLKIAANVTNGNFYHRHIPGKSIGIFYDQKIYKWLGFSTGIISTRFNLMNAPGLYFTDGWPPFPPQPIRTFIQYNNIEIPVDLTFCLSDKVNAPWKFYLNGGYSFLKLISREEYHFYSDSTKELIPRPFNLYNKETTLLSLGFEARHYNHKIKFATGVQFRFKPQIAYESKSVTMFNLYFKSGFDLRKKK